MWLWLCLFCFHVKKKKKQKTKNTSVYIIVGSEENDHSLIKLSPYVHALIALMHCTDACRGSALTFMHCNALLIPIAHNRPTVPVSLTVLLLQKPYMRTRSMVNFKLCKQAHAWVRSVLYSTVRWRIDVKMFWCVWISMFTLQLLHLNGLIPGLFRNNLPVR